MAIAITLKQYLSDHDITYDVVPHAPTMTSLQTAEIAHVPGDCLAKAVLLADGKRGYLLAVLPATHMLDVSRLADFVGRDLNMATEDDMADLFTDCAIGAVPALGEAYGLRVIWDDILEGMTDIYFEGGDHASLIHMSRDDFVRMMADAPHTIISHHI